MPATSMLTNTEATSVANEASPHSTGRRKATQ